MSSQCLEQFMGGGLFCHLPSMGGGPFPAKPLPGLPPQLPLMLAAGGHLLPGLRHPLNFGDTLPFLPRLTHFLTRSPSDPFVMQMY